MINYNEKELTIAMASFIKEYHGLEDSKPNLARIKKVKEESIMSQLMRGKNEKKSYATVYYFNFNGVSVNMGEEDRFITKASYFMDIGFNPKLSISHLKEVKGFVEEFAIDKNEDNI
jgi:hypothetical protein